MRTILAAVLLCLGSLSIISAIGQEKPPPPRSVFGGADEGPQRAQTRRVDDELINVLAKFPLDTEAVTVARGPFDLMHIAAKPVDEPHEPVPLTVTELQHMPIGILGLRDGAYGKSLPEQWSL